ncbi:MAG: DNA repair protein RecN [Pseudoxanthomonas sp.]
MLTRLALQDFAVVSAAELEFGPGMTVISGETGAGKSLLVDALGFLSGLRADSGVVRHGAQRAELSAEFALDATSPAAAWLRDNDLSDDGDDTCLLRRTIRADGGSRNWINGRGVTLSQLSELAALLVEIHGQHEHQALLSRSNQLALLDDYAGVDAELADVREAAARWRSLLDEREALSGQGDVSDRINYLEHQYAELQREDLDPAAIARLSADHRRQAHSAGLIDACNLAFARLNGDEGAAALHELQRARNDLSRVAEHEPRLREADALLDAAAIQIDEALSLIDRIRGDLDADPTQMLELEKRLSRLHDLARKHRVPPEQLIERRDLVSAELDALRGAGERLLELDDDIARAAAQWRDAAARLSACRRTAAARLAKAVTALIAELGIGGGVPHDSRFQIGFEANAGEQPDPLGAERVEFLIAANAGQPPRALRKAASGGELSRISLAIEVAALGSDAVQTMVFDEVDSGIGGAVAEIVGQKLRALGAQRQVLCVTHLPQVAAQGHAHYRVSKAPIGGVTQSAVELLAPAQRAEELARMLGGVEIGKEARAAAKRLLKDAV